MRVRWTPAAADDFENIANYLFEQTPENAARLIREIYRAPNGLESFPKRGRVGKKEGTRELKLGDRRDVPYSTPNHITEAWESPDHPPKKVFRMRRTLEYLAGHTAQQKSLQGVCTLVRWNGELPPQIARLTCGPPATFMNQRM